MDSYWVIRIIIFALMLSIVIALGSALFFIISNKSRKAATANALTVRISLSVSLFLLLFLSFAMGWIKPHGLKPTTSKQIQKGTTTPHQQNANTKPQPQKQNDAQH